MTFRYAIAGSFARISKEIVDGIVLDLHGAMVAEHVDDGEGELLARILWP